MNSGQLAQSNRLAWMLAAIGLMSLPGCESNGGDDGQPRGVQQTVGAAGGTVTHPDGAKVVIPAGALAGDVTIGIEATTAAAAPPLPPDFNPAGTMFVITPHGQVFSQPVELTVPFSAAQAPPGVRLTFFKTTNGASGPWEEVTGTTSASGTVTGQVSTFSFGLAGFTPQFTATGQPQNASVLVGQPATFTALAIGFNPPFLHQWQRSNDGGATFADIPGATAASYQIAAAALADAAAGGDNNARFRVIVTGSTGASITSDTATLTVSATLVAPGITTQPQNLTVGTGASATFTVIATGTAPSYQWQRSNDAGQSFTDLATDATAASYTLTNAQPGTAPAGDNGARFRVRVSNTAGAVISAAATLTVNQAPPPPGSPPRVAAGDNFTLAKSAGGQVRSWGSDLVGTLGDGGGDSSRNVPGLVSALPDAISIAAGAQHGLAIRADGSAWGWGYNGFGQLGHNATQTVQQPIRMTGATAASGAKIAVAGGTLHSLILRADGVVEATGYNQSGQLGDGTTTTRLEPVPVPNLGNVTAISAGGQHSMALLQNGEVWNWGRNDAGQLGNGTTADSSIPVRATAPGGMKYIAGGLDFSLAADDNGIWAWGSNLNGKLGIGDDDDDARLQPVAVLLPAGFQKPVKAIAAGAQFAMALDSSGVVYTWGINEVGQLGGGSLSPGMRTSPLPLIATFPPAGRSVTAIAAGRRNGLEHALAILDDGSVWAWGYNDAGQLGAGSTTPIFSSPVQVSGLNLN